MHAHDHHHDEPHTCPRTGKCCGRCKLATAGNAHKAAHGHAKPVEPDGYLKLVTPAPAVTLVPCT